MRPSRRFPPYPQQRAHVRLVQLERPRPRVSRGGLVRRVVNWFIRRLGRR